LKKTLCIYESTPHQFGEKESTNGKFLIRKDLSKSSRYIYSMKTLLFLLFACLTNTYCFGQTDTVKAKKYTSMCDSLSAKGKFDEAISKADTAIQANSSYRWAYYSRAMSKVFKQDMNGALDDLTACIKLMPKYSRAYYSRALIKIYLKDRDGACADLSKAKELGDSDEFGLIKQACQ